MVISKVDEDKNSSKGSKKEDKKSASDKRNGRVYTCGELEALTKSKTASKNIKKFKNKYSPKDPAIMQFSIRPDSKMIYNLDELRNLRRARMSQSPPACLYNPNVIRLNILKYTHDHPEDYENQMKSFRELLPKLSMSSWDPKFLDMLNNYHRSLLYPHYNYTNNSYNSQSTGSSNSYNARRVSWSDQKPMENQYDHLPTYQQKNFFDNITTATTMRPPAQPKYRYPYNSSTKMGSCGNERLNSYPINNSSGSLSMNETKSSYDESMDRTASTEFSEFDIKNHEKRDDVCNEPEPEWFSTPASRHDVIDLHGFEDDEGYRGHSSDDMMMMGKNPRQNYHQKQQKNCNYNGGRANYHHQQQQQQQQQRYRQSTSLSSFNSSGEQNNFAHSSAINEASIPVSPFFDMWKRKSNENLMPPPSQNPMNYYPKPRAMMTIADVEKAMTNAKQFMKARQQPPMNGIVQQMFQNAAAPQQQLPPNYPYQLPPNMSTFGFDNFRPGTTPSQEQLQQHTSEILKNAILRKHCNNESK